MNTEEMNKEKKFGKNIPLFLIIGEKEIVSPVLLHDYTDIDTVVNSKVLVALNYFVGFSVVVAVILIIFAGYNFITSAGDPEKIEKGQKGITAAIVGMIIVFLARTLVLYLIQKLTGTK
jgi:hypothetical protein